MAQCKEIMRDVNEKGVTVDRRCIRREGHLDGPWVPSDNRHIFDIGPMLSQVPESYC